MLGSGSREETDKEAGSAHFLEHFVFKGTQEFPKMFDINEAVEKVGGAFNAYTGQNEMGFWVKMAKENLTLATKIVAQIVTKPVLPKEHFDKERGRFSKNSTCMKTCQIVKQQKHYLRLCTVILIWDAQLLVPKKA
jgi:predicted Zn-dependent peptidase